MRKRFFISDTHFGHANMLRFKKDDGSLMRPGFDNADHMDEHMIECWNSVVKEQDTVHHLGDFGWGTDMIARIRKRLNGRIYLVLGNHDREDAGFYDHHFAKVRGEFHYTDKNACIICTHIPIHEGSLRYGKACINVHGHIHCQTIRDERYLNVSVEQIAYTPVEFDWVMDKAKKLRT